MTHLLIGFLSGLLLPAFTLQESDRPLPELNSFLQEVRKHLRSDRLLLSQYTYTQTNTERHLDGNGNVKKTEVEVYEVYPSLEEGQTYRKLISKDGKPLSPRELEKQDQEHEKKSQRENPEAGARKSQRASQAGGQGGGGEAQRRRDDRRDLPPLRLFVNRARSAGRSSNNFPRLPAASRLQGQDRRRKNLPAHWGSRLVQRDRPCSLFVWSLS